MEKSKHSLFRPILTDLSVFFRVNEEKCYTQISNTVYGTEKMHKNAC